MRKRAEFVAIAGEEWRLVPGHSSYEVSSLGRLRRLPNIQRRAHPKTGVVQEFRYGMRLLRPITTQYGYQQVNIDGKIVFLHRVVLTAFVGPSPAGHETCHGNGVRSDNRLANLRWDTRKANQEDIELHGKRPRGEKHPSAKYPDAVVAGIRSGAIDKTEATSRHGMTARYYDMIRYGLTRRQAA